MSFCSANDIIRDKADAVYLHSCDTEDILENGKYSISKKQYTLVNNLNASEEELMLGIKKNCKYEIRRAGKEEARFNAYNIDNTPGFSKLLADFEAVYNEMFIEKGLKNRFNMSLVKSGFEKGQVVITTCSCPAFPDDVVYHAYLADGENTVLMYSASPLWNDGEKERANSIGRMNKFLHWQDMLLFKDKGYANYEWGGISSPDEPNGIDKFKMEFGGEVVFFYNYIVGYSLLGRLYCALIKRRS